MNIKKLLNKAAVTAALFAFVVSMPPLALLTAQDAAAKRVAVGSGSSRRSPASGKSSPDFAFPQTVERDARGEMSEAIKTREYPKALSAMMKTIIARDVVSSSNVVANMHLCDSLAAVMPQPYSALASLIEARMLQEMYSQNSWQYSQRQLPADSIPENPAEWSRDIFGNKIEALVRNSAAGYDAAADLSLSSISPVLTAWKDADAAGMRADAFMMMMGADCLEPFSAVGYTADVIPFASDSTVTAGGQALYSGLCGRVYHLAGKTEDSCLRVYLDEWLAARLRSKGKDIVPFLLNELQAVESADGRVEILYDVFCNSSLSSWPGLYGNPDESEQMPDCISSGSMEYFGHAMPVIPTPSPEEFLSALRGLKSGGGLSAKPLELVNFMIASLSEQKVRLETPERIIPGDSIPVKVSAANLQDLHLYIFRMPDSSFGKNIYASLVKSSGKRVADHKISFSGSIPFITSRLENIAGLPAGVYAFVAAKDEAGLNSVLASKKRETLPMVVVTDLALLDIAEQEKWMKYDWSLLVVDGAEGRPVEGASIKIQPSDPRGWGDSVAVKAQTDRSDSDGMIPLDDIGHRTSCYVATVTKNGSMARERFCTGMIRPSESESTTAQIFTDLSIYHPGDTVGFSAVLYEVKSHSASILRDLKVKAKLRDANNESLDTLSFVTDADGRLSGSFPLPKEGMLGRWSVELSMLYGDNSEQYLGSAGVEVADYKAPSFYVELKTEESPERTGDTAAFSGEVKTYSGMPLAGCKVNYTVNYSPFWFWRRGGDAASFNAETVTDGDGSFTIELPTSRLRGTRFESGSFTITASALSPAGETRESNALSFSLGNGFSVSPDIPDMVEAEGDSIRFNVAVRDAQGLPVARTVVYSIKNSGGKVVADGEFTSPLFEIAAAQLPSGRYNMDFHIKGNPENCNGNGDAVSDVTIWRLSDRRPPVETALWLPKNNYVVPAGSTVKIPVGNSYPEGMVFCMISSSDGTTSTRWLRPDGGNIDLEVTAPDADKRMRISLLAMHSFKCERKYVNIIPSSQVEEMHISASSFRDRIVPGAKEHWSFSIDLEGKPIPYAPAMAVLSDKSLNALAPFAWDFSVGKGYWNFPGRIGYNNSYSAIFSKSWNTPKWLSFSPLYPRLDTFGRELYGGGHSGGFYAATESVSLTGAVLYENEVVNEVYDAAAPRAGVAQKRMMRSAAMKEETADEVMADNGASSSGEGGGSAQEDTPLREMEMPLAFFRPDLKADGSGTLTLDFDVPNFNTTWQLQVCGYDDRLNTAVLTLDAVAAKAVMVQTNAPRFLRYGDSASLSAMLFNNSTEEIPVSGKMEVFDPLTGRVLESREFKAEAMKAGGSRAVSMEFEVPSDIPALAIRSYAYGKNFSDGEQTLVKVLPNSSPVVESAPFFLTPAQREFEIKLPDFKREASVSLLYCDNPVWYTVTSLPTLMDTDSKDSFRLMNSLYGGSVSAALVERYPQINSALKSYFSEIPDGDRMLVSNLEKNPELKTIMLSATPWQADAAGETMRMGRLSNLLDKEENLRVMNTLTDKLSKLQLKCGGWVWFESGKEPSRFVTERLLHWFGMMKSSGVKFDSRMQKMTSRGMAWVEEDVVADFNKYYKGDDKNYPYSSLLSVLFTRSMLTSAQPSGTFGKLYTRALKAIAGDWRQFDVSDKATAALLLHRTGNHREASLILESLRQLASSSPGKGCWYDNAAAGLGALPVTARVLEAFAEISPESPMVEGLRQWLLLSRQTQDWGRNPYLAEVTYAILSSGVSWTDPAAPARITIGGKPLEIPRRDLLTGEFTIPLDAGSVSGKRIGISRDAAAPAWGGVVAGYIAPMESVKEVSVPDLSVSKQIVAVSASEDGGKRASVGDLKVGDRVRVTLTINCGKTMQYVALTDERPACLQPAGQISGYRYSDGLGYYCEQRVSDTNIFIENLPKGVYVISYECFVDRPGIYAEGIATVQSQYAPVFTAHSAGALLKVSLP